ncbi:MAG TPA: hypothetical protein VFN35_12840, partial [Ktedonobacteraceae bacterium]|nr:hypothetical protein [Ktedonobacteraceae bacterium]
MKLNEDGDFCLLYVESADEKQNLFETIGMQTKPVVLMLPLAPGQFRTRLFQRPEDFSDLKYIKRQTGVPVIFLTSSSEYVAQMATRHGFPVYPTIDALAESLASGRRMEREEGEARGYSSARRVRTGPLVPTAAQLAAIRRSLSSSPLHGLENGQSWNDVEAEPHERVRPAALPVEYAATSLNAPPDLGFWPGGEDVDVPFNRDSRVTPVPPSQISGSFSPITPTPLAESPFFEESPVPPRQREIPARRSALLPNEQYKRHPAWEPEAPVFDPPARSFAERVSLPSQPGRSPVSRSAPDVPSHSSAVPTRPMTGKTPPPLTPVPPPARPRRSRGLVPVLFLLSLLILGGAGIGSFVVITHVLPPAAPVAQPVGSITFINSQQLNDNTSQGIDDQVQINLHNLGTPAAGKSYYAWLLGDQNQAESHSILLGKLNVVNGSVKMLYAGDAQHTNLLQLGSRFLVTEETSDNLPVLPSPDTGTWRYYGALPATPDPNDAHHFSFLNHLRHLLADEPVLDELELPGGLNNWFARNTQKLIEWTADARDRWQNSKDVVSIRHESIRLISYLDGMSFMMQDMAPPSAKVQVALDTHLAGIGLLNVRGEGQNPPSYLDQIVYHLNGLINSPGSPANVRKVAQELLAPMSNITASLKKLRSDVQKLLAMTDKQLTQSSAFTLLNDAVLQASNAYAGTNDPATGQFQQGVVWVHQ